MNQIGPIFDDNFNNRIEMLVNLRKLFLLSILILFIPGCKKDTSISERQSVLFQFEYINYAWGYQHQGFIIDNKGNVLTYNNPEGWNFPDNNLNITEIQFNENLDKCRLTDKKIPQEIILKYSAYIKQYCFEQSNSIKECRCRRRII